MNWKVVFTSRAEKELKRLPEKEQRKARALVNAIEILGPVQGGWPNYSRLGFDKHHCHLSYRYVMVWRVVDKEAQTAEVQYVGSRENAPY